MISTNLGDQPHDILRGAAEEVLACLKNDAMTDPERKRETEKLINSVTPEVRRTGVDGLGQRRRGAIRATSRRAPDDVRLGGLRVGVRGRAPPERVRQSGQIVAAHEGGEAGGRLGRLDWLGAMADPRARARVAQAFGKLVSIGKRITDFMVEDGAGNEKLDDELGVAVVFDEEDEQVTAV